MEKERLYERERGKKEKKKEEGEIIWKRKGKKKRKKKKGSVGHGPNYQWPNLVVLPNYQ